MENPHSAVARKIASALEEGLPLSPEPFAGVAGALGIDQDSAVSVTESLLHSGSLRRFGAFWDFSPFYSAYLFGAKVAPEKLGHVSDWINGLDSVTHSYLRDHELNLWFTAIFKGNESALMLAKITEKFRAKDIPFAALGTVRRIKLRPSFAGHRPDGGDGVASDVAGLEFAPMPGHENKFPQSLNETQKKIIALLQKDMKPQRRLFESLAACAGMSEQECIRNLAELRSLGFLRRIGASVNHNAAGYTANSLMAFDVSGIPEGEAALCAAKAVSGHPWASHCYLRNVVASSLGYPWRHCMFVMIHARSGTELAEREGIIVSSLSGTASGEIISMMTLREYKKTSFIFDVESIDTDLQSRA